MPNWVEGNIRFRGACKNIKALCENELECMFYGEGFTVDTCKPVIDTEFYSLALKYPETQKDMGVWPGFHFKGTRRNFLEGKFAEAHGEYDTEDEREVRILLFDCFKAAWGIDAAPYLAIAKKYDVDIHIFGWERGMEFTQEIEIINGEIVKDEEGKYDDWGWECPMAHLGG